MKSTRHVNMACYVQLYRKFNLNHQRSYVDLLSWCPQEFHFEFVFTVIEFVLSDITFEVLILLSWFGFKLHVPIWEVISSLWFLLWLLLKLCLRRFSLDCHSFLLAIIHWFGRRLVISVPVTEVIHTGASLLDMLSSCKLGCQVQPVRDSTLSLSLI